MKTKEQILRDFFDLVGYTVDNSNAIHMAFDEYEKLVRKEQDKITRHACAENVTKISRKCDDHAQARVVWLDEVHSVIINTKSI